MSEPTRPKGASDSDVAVATGAAGYGGPAPFSPDRPWPEYCFAKSTLAQVANPAYEAVRDTLQLLRLDGGRTGTSNWNPLGGIVHPGDTVVLKPNLVREFRDSNPHHADCVVTHGAIVRAILDYAYLALEGRGRLIIADAPHNDADFDAIRRIVGLDDIRDFYERHAQIEVEVFDLRPERAEKIDGVIVGHVPLRGDPAGYVRVNLGGASELVEVNHFCHLLYGSEYDAGELYRHHHGDVHEYLVAKTILDADVVISVPKLKTHKKTGITVNMKNLVGINGNKNWLPHHREGTPAQGGDQFPDDRARYRLERTTVAAFKKAFPLLGRFRPFLAGPLKMLGKRIFGDTNVNAIRSGNWHGNDTTWRMVIDLNRILRYADAEGILHNTPVRRFFSVVDGIVAGEGNGPMDPIPKPAGLIATGFNPVAVDLVCARLMGFDFAKLPVLARSLMPHRLPLVDFEFDDVAVSSNDVRFRGVLSDFRGRGYEFKPHFGWRGHIEAPEVQKAEPVHS